MPDGKPENQFAFNGEFKDAEFAHKEYFYLLFISNSHPPLAFYYKCFPFSASYHILLISSVPKVKLKCILMNLFFLFSR